MLAALPPRATLTDSNDFKTQRLFIMRDQLRFDYPGCTGHWSLKTPNVDTLAGRGVRFTDAYVQSPVCGPSRISTYGRRRERHGAARAPRRQV